jgi:hypothetical protein
VISKIKEKFGQTSPSSESDNRESSVETKLDGFETAERRMGANEESRNEVTECEFRWFKIEYRFTLRS